MATKIALKKIQFIQDVTGCNGYEAEEALWAANWNVDVAAVTVLDAQAA